MILSVSLIKETITNSHDSSRSCGWSRPMFATGRENCVGYSGCDRKKTNLTMSNLIHIEHMVKSEMTPKNLADFWNWKVLNRELISSVSFPSITTLTMLLFWEATTET